MPGSWYESTIAELLEILWLHPKAGLVWCFLESSRSRVFHYSVSVQREPRFSLILNQLSLCVHIQAAVGRSERNPKKIDSHARRCRKSGFVVTWVSLCLPVILKFNGLPKPPKTPQLPSREKLGDSTQLRLLPRLSCGPLSQSQSRDLGFQNLNIPKRSFQTRTCWGQCISGKVMSEAVGHGWLWGGSREKTSTLVHSSLYDVDMRSYSFDKHWGWTWESESPGKVDWRYSEPQGGVC